MAVSRASCNGGKELMFLGIRSADFQFARAPESKLNLRLSRRPLPESACHCAIVGPFRKASGSGRELVGAVSYHIQYP